MAEDDVTLEDEQQADAPESGGDEELSPEKKLMERLKETVELEQEDIGTLRRKLKITVPRATIDERLGEQFDELRRDSIVPGFRKGRAPLRLVEKRYGADVGDQLITTLVTSAYLAATEKHNIKTLGDPLFHVRVTEDRTDPDGRIHKVESDKLVDIKQALENIKLPHDGPLVYSCEIELRPEFELPVLDGIPVAKPRVSITDQDVETELNRLLMMRATLMPVNEGPIEPDDAVLVDLKLVCDGTAIKSENNAMLSARDQTYAGIPLKGLGDLMVGKLAGDTGSLSVSVPDDYDDIAHRGKPATFEFTMLEFKRLTLPVLDAELLSALGFESEQELRDLLRQRLGAGLESVIQRGMRNQVSKYLIDNTPVEVPSTLSQRQAERLIAGRLIEMYQAGVPEPEIAKRMDELKTAAQTEAVNDLKLFFIIEKIAEERKIDITEEELNGAIAQIAARRNTRFDRMRDELSRAGGMQTLIMRLRDDKVIDDLLANASIAETEGPPA